MASGYDPEIAQIVRGRVHTTATIFDADTTRAVGRAISHRPTPAATTPIAMVTTHWTWSALKMSVIAIADPAATSHRAPAIPSLFIVASQPVRPAMTHGKYSSSPHDFIAKGPQWVVELVEARLRPARSAVATPGSDKSSGMSSVLAILAAPSRSVSP